MKDRLLLLRVLFLVFLQSLPVLADQIIINEIMYHAAPAMPEDDTQEWLELFNKGTTAVNLNGWKFTKGISFTFPNVTIPAGGHLVVAANTNSFAFRYPTVTNVIGNWVGVLSNNGDELELDDAAGNVVDDVAYASEGDWAMRVRGPLDRGFYGWAWFTEADGLGKSIELVNSAMPNKYGQNWASSLVQYGTPGAPNSVLAPDIAPLIVDASHFPAVPTSADAVYVTARILDEQASGFSVTLFYRPAIVTNPPPFASAPMFDDGAHGEGGAGDGVYGAILPPNPDGTIMEFYIQAQDAGGHTRTYPAAARQLDGITFGQTANMIYQVSDEVYAGNQPFFRLIMTEAERQELTRIWNASNLEGPNSLMNGTLVYVDAQGTDVRYTCGFRNRGHGSRTATPHGFRVDVPNDRRWKGFRLFNLNTQYVHSQVGGSAMFHKGGLNAANSRPVQVRINNINQANSGPTQFGSYAHNEELTSDFVQAHFPTDPGGNAYRGVRQDSPSIHADFTYRGTDPNNYSFLYPKQNNISEDDWSDLIELCDVMSNTPDAQYTSEVRRVFDVDAAMIYFAANTLADNGETALSNGNGDDYSMYRGGIDRRFKLMAYDMDTLFGQGDSPGQTNASLFRMTNNNTVTITRFITWPEFAPLYYATLKHLIETSFSPTAANETFVRALGDFVPPQVITNMVTWVRGRDAYVLSRIPLNLTAGSSLPVINGYPQTTVPSASLNGFGNAIETRSVRVNGSPATWNAHPATWTATVSGLLPGINRVLVQAFGTNGTEIARTNIDIWYNNGAQVNVSGAINGNTTWTAATGPYNVTGPITVGNGATLNIQPGTTVYFASGATLTVSGSGRLLAEGSEMARIRFTRVPGGNNWASLDFIGATNESRLAYVDFEFCGGTTIGGHNAQVHVNGGSKVFIDHCIWPPTPVVEYISFDGSSFIVQNCYFPSYPPPTGPESLHGINGIPANGYGIFRDNYFGHTWGFNDTIDFTGGNRPGPILQIINNVFDGASDDCLDLDSTDAWIEGNIFMHVHRDPTRNDNPLDTSSAISGGVDFIGQNPDWTIINNLFYDVDHVFLNKGNSTTIGNGGGRVAFLYNTVIHVAKEYSGSSQADIAAFDWSDDDIVAPAPAVGSGMYAAYNIIYDCPVLHHLYDPAHYTIIMDNNILSVPWTGPGSGNQVINPGLNLAILNGIAPTNVTVAQLRRAAQVLPDSPAFGAGFGGLNLGAYQSHGITIAGEPLGTTISNSAALLVGPGGTFNWGTNAPQPWGWTAFKWKLDNGPWSAEIPFANNPPFTNLPVINLTGLSEGPHTVYAVGKNDAGPGYYQDDTFVYPTNAGIPARITASRTWTVNSAYSNLRLNEVLAKNQSAFVHNDGYPDLIELYNDGGAPISLAGMGITDDSANKFKFTFPPGASIAAGEYLVLFADNPDGSVGIHLGFALDATGDGVYLYNSNGTLLDSVVFGLQLPDLSLGRMPDGSWTLNKPTFGAANIPQGVGDPRLLKINEWLTDSQNKSLPDFIELFNTDSLPVDMGGLYLTEAPQGSPKLHQIPALSFIAGSGYTVFYADGHEKEGNDHLSFKLSPLGGQIALFAADLTLIDCIFYGPQSPDVSEGRTPDGSNHFGFFQTPTPGSANPGSLGGCTVTTIAQNLLPMISTWNYNRNGIDLGTSWRAPAYDDSSWSSGLALLGVEDCNCLPFALNTIFQNYVNSQPIYYFRTTFDVSSNLSGINLQISYVLDDGAVIYLDGVEVRRINMSQTATIIASTRPTSTVGDATLQTLTIPGVDLAMGTHSVAVEVHNAGGTSSDIVWGMALDVTSFVTNCAQNTVVLNEVMANPVNAVANDGALTDWVELFNPSASTIDLAGMSLSDDINLPRRWVFPAGISIAPGDYLVVHFDGASAPSTNGGPVLNTGFGLDADGDRVLLYEPLSRGGGLLDSITFGSQPPDYTIGRVPNSSGPWVLSLPTPGAANIGAGLGDASLLKVNEWMADPSSGPDWFEIYNPNAQPVDLSGLYLTDDLNNRNQYRIPALSFVGAGENGFVQFFADGTPSLGAKHTNFRLSAGGESIGIFAKNLRLIDAITFLAQQRGVSEGRFPDGSANITRFPGTETPAASNLLPLKDIVINEVLSHTDAPLEDAIELHNPTTGSVDLSGWFLTNKRTDPKRFRIPDGTIIPPGGFAVFYAYQFNRLPGVRPSFDLDSIHGDQVYLFSADLNGNLLGYRTGVSFDAAENGVSLGRYFTSTGIDFTALSQRTFGVDNPANLAQFRTGTGLTNAYPKVGPVVINEIMYHPPPQGTNDDVIDEFIELKNITGAPVPLFDPNFPTNTWRLRDGVDFHFPPSLTIPANEYLLVVNFDPVTNATALAEFRARYSLSPSVPIFGPYGGKLDNGGENVELVKPDAPQAPDQPDPGFVPHIVVDHVNYSDSAPWPSAADGNTNGVGLSLQRKNSSAYGNDPVNWIAGLPSPGAATGPGVLTPPAITSLTPSQIVALGANVTLTVTASGASPLAYQWSLNGVLISGATNASLLLGNVQASHVGDYSVLVSNPAGAASGVTRLDVMLPPVITKQPQSQVLPFGGTALFTVTVQGSLPLAYQWRKNGSDLGGATKPALIITNTQSQNEGAYTVVITGAYGSVTSAPAALTLSAAPVILAQPQSTNALVGMSIAFTVVAGGSQPLSYQWFFNNTAISGATNASLALNNVQLSSSGNYTVRVTNSLGSVLSAIASLNVATAPIVTVVATDPSAAEAGLDPGMFTISRIGPIGIPLTVYFTVAGSATPDDDYISLGSPVTIQSGAASTNIVVMPIDDFTPEPVETVILTISSGTDYVPGSPASATVNIFDDDNQAPSVGITSPVNGASFTGPVNVPIAANASDSDGSIGKVEFYYDGSNKIGTSLVFPYGVTWTNALGGTHLLTAVATDNLGLSRTSAPVSIYINIPPTVSITAPGNGASFVAPAVIFITASATDNGSITLVEFFAGTNLVGNAANTPYSFTWTNVPIGEYSLTARATDNNGVSSISAPVTVSVHEPVPEFADFFGVRGVLTGYTNYIIGNNIPYTHELGEPAHDGKFGTNSAWISWTAPDSGMCMMTTTTNGLNGVSNLFDTVLAVYAGNIISNLASVASNDDDPASTRFTSQSRVTFPAVAGATYQIAVDSYGVGQGGNIYFRMSLPNSYPVITNQPQSQIVNPAADVTFTVGARSPTPLTYQWMHDGDGILGATNPVLVLNGVTSDYSGVYSVILSNATHSITSAPAILTVRTAPVIVQQPQVQIVDPGSNAVFSVSASGGTPYTYQWRFNGNDIPGANSNPFVLANVQHTSAGNYSVIVGNSLGSADSQPAELIVRPKIIQGLYLGNGSFRLTLNGTPGKQYAIESATHMPSWTVLGHVTNSAVQLDYLDTSASSTNRAYRLRLVP